MISESVRAKILGALRARNGSWSGFQDEQFIKDETRYKRKVVADAQPLIAQPVLEELLEQERWDDFLAQLEKAGQRSVNLLYMNVPKSGDLRLLYDPALVGDLRAEFCRAFFQLLYGSGSAPTRLEAFVAFLQANNLPVYWTLPTYFLFISDPEHNILVKPATIHSFLKFIDADELWSTVPTANGYQAILDTASIVRAALVEYGQADLIDIQSVMYVCATIQGEYSKSAQQTVPPPNDQEIKLVSPYDRIFPSYEVANMVFDFVHAVFKVLDIQDEEDQRFSLTLPQKYGGDDLCLNYGTWLLLDVDNRPEVHWFEIALKECPAAQQLSQFRNQYPSFKRKPNEPLVHFYRIPIEHLANHREALMAAIAESHPYIRERFAGRTKCLYRRHNRPELAKAVFDQGYRRRLLTGTADPDPRVMITGAFDPEAFRLLEEFSSDPTVAFYQAHQLELQTLVKTPFQNTLLKIAKRLPDRIRNLMETEKRLFSSFRKNDFEQGGAWTHYWGAFYPKGSKRSQDAQLSMWINYELFEYGFYIGNYGSTQRQRFSRNSQLHAQLLEPIFTQLIGDAVRFGSRDNLIIQPDGVFAYRNGITPTWAEFLRDPSRFDNDVSYFVAPEDLVELDEDTLVERVLDGFRRLFPLVLLATLDEPIAEIEAYVAQEVPELDEEEAEDEVAPSLPLPDIAKISGFSEVELKRWVAAIRRKQQAIFYGPPGTGKTFIACKLAQHLIGGGDGFWDLVQFHPAYAYEDFIQGIRPRPMTNGGLEYPVVRGRFLEFCHRAAQCKGPCVLIIDEVNRANLARVFGELMYLLEYRDETIKLAASDQGFRIPRNVYIIGTMNTADRSIALVDHALRRRFAFIKLEPNYAVLSAFLQKNGAGFDPASLVEVLQEINRQIGDPHYSVGISFFLRNALAGDLEDIWRMEIEPYLEEYFFDQRDLVKKFGWEQVASRLLSGGVAHG